MRPAEMHRKVDIGTESSGLLCPTMTSSPSALSRLEPKSISLVYLISSVPECVDRQTRLKEVGSHRLPDPARIIGGPDQTSSDVSPSGRVTNPRIEPGRENTVLRDALLIV